jgi:hypothetical protein
MTSGGPSPSKSNSDRPDDPLMSPIGMLQPVEPSSSSMRSSERHCTKTSANPSPSTSASATGPEAPRVPGRSVRVHFTVPSCSRQVRSPMNSTQISGYGSASRLPTAAASLNGGKLTASG